MTTTDASLLLLAAALAYASLGWPVIPLHTPKDDGTCDCNRPKAKGPCENVGKHPRTRNGLDDATTDEDTIRRWWKMFPNANIGIALEGAQLVDIAPDGIPYWAEFHSRGMPETIRFSSGGGEGHEHSLYRRPEHCPAYRLTQSGDFDILSHGYCVAPPSRHKSGQLYRWLDPIESLPIAGPTAIAPEWAVAMLLEKARRPKGRVAHAQGADDDGPPIELEGEDLERWHGRMFDPREDGGVDRSYSLWSLAMLLLRASVRAPYVEQLLAERDAALGWLKFTNRRDADERYRTIVDRAVEGKGPKRIHLGDDRENGHFEDSDGPNARARAREKSSSATEWPVPTPLDAGAPAPQLDLSLFPREIADVAGDAAYRQQAPVDFVVWPLTVSLAALCGRDVGIRPRAHDDWTERLALWAALIGPPSTMKTPALAEGTRVLTRIAAKLREDYLAELEQWKQDCLAEKQANGKHAELPEKPVFQRVWTAEATIEKLAMIIGEQSPRGVAIVRDELAGLIFGLDRYHPGSGGDRQFLLQAYSGGAYVVDRMSRPSVFIDDLLLNIAGGVQPERARELFGEGVDDGLAARFLTVFPGLPGRFRVIDRYPDMAARHALDGVADTLFRTHWGDLLHTDTFRPTPFCTLEDEGRELFSDWHEQVVARARSADLESRQSARIGKYPGLAARLMLLFHLVEWAAGRCRTILRVTAETTAHVLDLMDTYVQPMEDRVYLAYADSVVTAAGRRVARWILTKGVERFTPRDVRQLRYEGVREHGEAERVVEWLCAMGWAREEDARVRVGRPSQTYLVNPGVKGFAN